MVKEYIIESGNPKNKYLKVSIPGAKNSILPILAATMLLPSKVKLFNVPKINDINNMIKIIISLGGTVVWNDDFLEVDCTAIIGQKISFSLTEKVRSSILLVVEVAE